MRYRRPASRRLRAYAFDPLLSTELATRGFNEITLLVPWEEGLEPGPRGEYVEVVDVDPASGSWYAPVDLNDPYLLAQDGLGPAEGNAQFHQQMVYGVVMTTIGFFERALGRKSLWRSRLVRDESGAFEETFVPRLRVYPHALREANAFYSPDKIALLFGYFPASESSPGKNLPGGTVFTCLSHDVVAHETTHALLDGLHTRFIEASNADALAFHEAFADIVALFQHFSYGPALRAELARARGDLSSETILSGLAQQFGQATGYSRALRVYVGTEPDPGAYVRVTEPHARGALLVAAVFDAFLTIYRHRTADLFRMAAAFGAPQEADLQADLLERLAGEAAKSASQVLNICIRALDYCPPVDMTFGDYLRALVTADRDVVPRDEKHYRLAFVEAFRRRGIYPQDVRSLSEHSLLWHPPRRDDGAAFAALAEDREALWTGWEGLYRGGSRQSGRLTWPRWRLDVDRERTYSDMRDAQRLFWYWLMRQDERQPERLEAALRACGLTLAASAPRSIVFKEDRPALEVHSVRPARRVGPDGERFTDYVVVVTQRRRGYFDRELQAAVDAGEKEPPEPDFWFRGGCTLLVDFGGAEVRYVITKDICSDARLERQRRFLVEGVSGSTALTYFGDSALLGMGEPLRGVHKLAGGL